MKIAVLGHLKFPIGAPFAGGLERHTHALTVGLQARGHKVTLFAAEGSDPALGAVAMCAPTRPHTGDADGDAILDAIEGAAYARMMVAVAEDGFDIVHVNSLHALPLHQSRQLRIPMVTVLHVPAFEPFSGGLREASPDMRIVAVSRQLAAIWQDIAPRIDVIGNGIDLATFAPRDIPADEPYACWSGRISPEKGLHLAIDAARMAGITLAFAGPRADDAYWREEILPRLGPGVRDAGHLGEAALAAHLGGASVAVVSPLWEEPFGLVVVEALGCGTPVAAFARGAVPDILDGRTGCLAIPGDVTDLARAIREAAKLDRSACRARAETHYGIDRMLDAYEALYRDMLGAGRKPVAAS